MLPNMARTAAFQSDLGRNQLNLFYQCCGSRPFHTDPNSIFHFDTSPDPHPDLWGSKPRLYVYLTGISLVVVVFLTVCGCICEEFQEGAVIIQVQIFHCFWSDPDPRCKFRIWIRHCDTDPTGSCSGTLVSIPTFGTGTCILLVSLRNLHSVNCFYQSSISGPIGVRTTVSGPRWCSTWTISGRQVQLR